MKVKESWYMLTRANKIPKTLTKELFCILIKIKAQLRRANIGLNQRNDNSIEE
jgi:hypothetical protein